MDVDNIAGQRGRKTRRHAGCESRFHPRPGQRRCRAPGGCRAARLSRAELRTDVPESAPSGLDGQGPQRLRIRPGQPQGRRPPTQDLHAPHTRRRGHRKPPRRLSPPPAHMGTEKAKSFGLFPHTCGRQEPSRPPAHNRQVTCCFRLAFWGRRMCTAWCARTRLLRSESRAPFPWSKTRRCHPTKRPWPGSFQQGQQHPKPAWPPQAAMSPRCVDGSTAQWDLRRGTPAFTQEEPCAHPLKRNHQDTRHHDHQLGGHHGSAPAQAVHIRRPQKASRKQQAPWRLCADGPMGPVVHLCAGKARRI